MAFHRYLFFNRDCREAFVRYQEIFGRELFLMKMSNAPSEEVPAADLILHAALKIEGDLLMGSDDPTAQVGPIEGTSVSYSSTDAAEAPEQTA